MANKDNKKLDEKLNKAIDALDTTNASTGNTNNDGELKDEEEHKAKHEDEGQNEDAEARALIREYFKTETFTKQYMTKVLNKTTDMIVQEHGYSMHEKLGQGAFATVFKVTRTKDDKTIAVKVIDISEKRERRLEDLRYEIYVLERTNHTNIIKLFEHFIIDEKVYIFMDFADSGTLSDHVRKKGPLSEKRAKRWFCQYSKAVHHMHKLGISHRDLKLGNILLDKNGFKKTECKVTDFGLSRISYHKSKGITMFTTYCGTPPYMAPEIIDKGDNGKRSYDPFSADIWALGVCLYAMVNKAYPFNPENMDHMLRNQKEKKWKFVRKQARIITDECKNIVDNMLEPDPAKRITFAGIFQHKWTEMTQQDRDKLSNTNTTGTEKNQSNNDSANQ
ncbi:Testis-specific serine/threonine-protein kinase 1 [Halotydeus destructor]|nr:Testis-specific serine/threonine-protein kinase 1 [Halotydeus destructor]